MNHVLSVKEFFTQDEAQLSQIKESFLKMSWEALENIRAFTWPEAELTEAEQSRVADHQVYLLSAFPSVQSINENESRLYRAGYQSVLLTESNTYEATLTALVINENILTSIWSFLKKVTNSENEANPRGIFQFVLDILGIIPGIGTPANLLNAGIYFLHNEYLLALMNLLSMIPIGGTLMAPFKIASKTFGKVFAKVGLSLAKSGGGKIAATEAKQAIKDPSILKLLGNVLGTVGKWILSTGSKLVKNIVPNLVAGIKKVTGGLIDLTKYIPKLNSVFDSFAAKLSIFGKEADDASKALLSGKTAAGAEKTVAKSATKVSQSAVDKATLRAKQAGRTLNRSQANMVRTQSEQEILNKAGKLTDFQTVVMANSASKFDKLFPNITNKSIRDNWIINDAAKELTEKVLSKKTGLLSITGNKKLMQTLATGKTWKGADRMLANAIKKGDPDKLGKVMKRMMDDPEFYKLISRNSPEIAKTLALFKEVPEALIKGSSTFKSFGPSIIKGGIKLAYVRYTAERLPMFLLKVLLKSTDCGKFITSAETLGDSASMMGQVAKQKAMQAVSEILETVPITEQDDRGISQDVLNQLKTSDPETYRKIIAAQQEADRAANDLKTKTDSANPCFDLGTVKSAQVGCIIDTNNRAWKKGTVETPLRTNKEWQESNLNNYTKGVLSALNQDTGIDAQHPLINESPVVKAYFSDIVTYDGAIDPNVERSSRIDVTLDRMVAAGEITAEQKPALKKKILEHWANNTMPEEMVTSVEEPSQANESFLKIRKLTTVR